MFTRPQLIILGIFGFIALFVLFILVTGVGLKEPQSGKAQLAFWGVDDPAAWNEAIAAYEKTNSGAVITYTQIPENQYEARLVDALAAGEGPDMFMFRNTWLSKHGNKILPAPASLIVPDSLRELFPQA